MAAGLRVTQGLAVANRATAATVSVALWATRTLGSWRLRAIRMATRALGSTPAAVAASVRGTAAFALCRTVFPNPLQHFSACCFGCGLHHIATGWLARAAPNGLTPHGNGLCHFTRLGAKTIHHLHRNGLLGETLDVLHKAFFVQTHQVHCSAVVARTPGAADAVHIV